MVENRLLFRSTRMHEMFSLRDDDDDDGPYTLDRQFTEVSRQRDKTRLLAFSPFIQYPRRDIINNLNTNASAFIH